MDPFKILQVKYTDTLNHIKNVFRSIVLKHHPDRGGDPETFAKYKDAYDAIHKFKTENLQQIHRENISFDDYLQTRKKIENNRRPREQILNPSNLNLSVFNKIYESTRLEDAYDIGRESFLKDNNNKKKRAMVRIHDPDKLYDSVLQNIREIGVNKVNDLSVYNLKNKKGMQCSDIKFAFENKESLKDIKNPINTRKQSNLNSQNASKYANKRNNISYEMSAEDKKYYDYKRKKDLELEHQRRFHAKRQSEIEKRQWERLTNFISL